MPEEFEALFGPVVGRGAQATVYATDNFAVKLYRAGYPKTSVFAEAYAMASLEQEHFPSPKVYEVLFVDGRYGLRMERVNGTLMSECMTDGTYKQVLNTLVDLQCRLQRENDAIEWAPDIKVRFGNDLARSETLSPARREELLGLLDSLPDGKALCHCDFHAGNVFFDGKSYTIIDLLQVSRGDPAADAACSYLSYYFHDPKQAYYYLHRYCEVSGVPVERVRQWLRVYAGTLPGQVPEKYEPVVERLIAGEEL